ncbi:MAG: WbqC family protein [Nitrospirae bacterium]|nr:WbqC family protein [Nitrospirota bacterium]
MKPNRIVAIHQPNFFPWLGYFNKINKADIFILMDNVQFPKKGGIWTNRVKISINGCAQWITVPVVRNYHGFRSIKEMEINDSTGWRGKILKTIEQNYKKCPFFEEEWEYIAALIKFNTANLCDFNIYSVKSLTEHLGFDSSKLVIGSSLKTGGSATELLISMTKAAGGDAYMCGGGADGYQENSKFAEAGLKLQYQNFQHPVYPQLSKEFIPGLSIIDALFNIGAKKCSEILRTR